MTDADRLAFVTRVLRVFEIHDQYGDLFWRSGRRHHGTDYAKPASFFVVCNDVFWWGTADLEEVTPENVAELERAYDDAAGTCDIGGIHGAMLFAARARGMRPQGAAYPQDAPPLWPLLDACGPPRATGAGNPRPSPVTA